jgi:membrane protease YdiL (CAAX protease family)
MESNRVALKTLALATAGVVGIEALARWGIGQWGLAPLTGTALSRLIDIAWMALIISSCPQGWAHIGLGRGSGLPGLRRGLIWSAGFGALAALGWGMLHAAGIEPLRLLYPSPVARPANPALFFLVGGFIGPVAEEIFFRGLIYGYLRRWGFWPALALSTLIFTLLHTGASGVPIPQIVGGLVFATAYEIEKKLLVPITIHILGNLALFSLPYFIRL